MTGVPRASAQVGGVPRVSAQVGGVRRIAVLRANALGDFVLALPALEALKNTYPDATLTLLGRAWHAAFLEGRPGPVDEVVVLPPITGVSTSERGREAPGELVERLRARRFDLAVQIHGGGRCSNPWVRGLGARLTVGLRAPEAGLLDRWVRYSYYQHEVLRHLEVAALVGGRTGRIEPRMAVTAGDEAEVARLGELPRGLVAALYARCDLVISNDTGPCRLAAAVGTATVVVYWCGNLINAGPLSRHRHRPLISWTAACPVCGASGTDLNAGRCGHDPSWVAGVPVEAVVEEAMDVLAPAGGAR